MVSNVSHMPYAAHQSLISLRGRWEALATLFGGRVLQRRSWLCGASIVSSVCSHTCLLICLDLACMPFKFQRDPTLSFTPCTNLSVGIGQRDSAPTSDRTWRRSRTPLRMGFTCVGPNGASPLSAFRRTPDDRGAREDTRDRLFVCRLRAVVSNVLNRRGSGARH